MHDASGNKVCFAPPADGVVSGSSNMTGVRDASSAKSFFALKLRKILLVGSTKT